MKLIVPMAGRGTRLRPHTHVTPKPLLPVAGRSMVERIVETFADVLPGGLDEAVFILGPDFGDEVREQLTDICCGFGMAAHFGVQEKALGTAHAAARLWRRSRVVAGLHRVPRLLAGRDASYL